MLELYKKVEKSLDNLYGVISIQNLKELDKPFLLCLSAQDSFDKSVFGLIKEGARAARVNTSSEMAAGFKIDEFPVAFLGLKFKKDEKFKENYEEIVDSLIYPFLVGDGDKTIEDIKKTARKINFMTYCNGTLTYANMEKRLESKLQSEGYSLNDIKDILSQISLISIGSMVDASNLRATTVSFIDINDDEIYTEKTDLYQKLLADKEIKSLYGFQGEANSALYIYDGSGNHSLKEYFLDNNKVKPAISSVLAMFLQNSVKNENIDELVPISLVDALEQLSIYGDETKDPKFLLENLDNTLSYGAAPKYNKDEAKIRQELDTAYLEIRKIKTKLKTVESEKNKKEETINSIIDGIRKYSSDTTFYQILVSSKVWQAPSERDVFQEQSDKEVREEYNQLQEENKNVPKL